MRILQFISHPAVNGAAREDQMKGRWSGLGQKRIRVKGRERESGKQTGMDATLSGDEAGIAGLSPDEAEFKIR